MPDTPNNDHALPDDALTDDERAEQTQQIEAARTAYEAVRRNGLALAAALLVLLRSRLFREHGTFAAFVEATFEFTADYGYKHARWARLNEILTTAGEAPLEVESHARSITPLMEMPPNSDHVTAEARDRVLQAVRMGRSAAEAEGVRLIARHFGAARQEAASQPHTAAEPDAEVDEASAIDPATLRDTIAELDALAGPTGETVGDGLHVIVRGAVSPWEDDIECPVDHATPADLSPVRIDEIAGVAYPVLIPGPRETADTWEAPEGPFRATYRPDRIGTPAPADAEAPQQDRVVLVAPGVDLLHDDVPDRVLDEITASVGSDPTRLYLVRTDKVERAISRAWPPNVSIVVEARTADQLTALIDQVRDSIEIPWTLVLRDLAAPPTGGFGDSLDVFSWVLVRGKDTSWWTLGDLYGAVLDTTLHVGKEVRARPVWCPLIAGLTAPAATERTDRAPAPVRGARRREGGPALPPELTADAPSR